MHDYEIDSGERKKQNGRIKWVISGLEYDDLTEWEQQFIESVEDSSDKGYLVSEKRMVILEKIYREKGK